MWISSGASVEALRHPDVGQLVASPSQRDHLGPHLLEGGRGPGSTGDFRRSAEPALQAHGVHVAQEVRPPGREAVDETAPLHAGRLRRRRSTSRATQQHPWTSPLIPHVGPEVGPRTRGTGTASRSRMSTLPRPPVPTRDGASLATSNHPRPTSPRPLSPTLRASLTRTRSCSAATCCCGDDGR